MRLVGKILNSGDGKATVETSDQGQGISSPSLTLAVNVNLSSSHELEIGYFYDIVGRVDQDLGGMRSIDGCLTV